MKLKKASFAEMKESGTKLSFSELMKLRGGSSYADGTCAFNGWIVSSPDVICDISKAAVDAFIEQAQAHERSYSWCCDSCSQTGWWQSNCFK